MHIHGENPYYFGCYRSSIYVFSLLNKCYFEIPFAEHFEHENETRETAPKDRVGRKRKKLLKITSKSTN
jgi:hypothetical protein